MSPADLGKIVYMRIDDNGWYGPCLSVDVARRSDFVAYINGLGEVLEVSDTVRALFGFESSILGEAYVGTCPPRADSQPSEYSRDPHYPPGLTHESFDPYPAQQMPEDCKARRYLN